MELTNSTTTCDTPLLESVAETGGNAVAESPRSKGGAPRNNQNAALYGLTGGGWRDEWQQDRRCVNQFMRSLERAVLAAGGSLDIPTMATIQTAGRLERVARLANRATRTDTKLSNTEVVDLAERAAKASLQRDKCLMLLGLDQRASKDMWDAIDAPRAPIAAEASNGWHGHPDGLHETSTT